MIESDFPNLIFTTHDLSVFDPYVPVKVSGFFTAWAERPDGSIRWRVANKNGVVNAGFNQMLDSMFRSSSITTYSNWYMGLISNAGYSALNVADTMSSHAGWTEDTIHYNPATTGLHPPWSPSAASNKTISNPSPTQFLINTDNTVIKGIFITTEINIGGVSGLLWSTGLFGSDQTLFNGDTLKITYSVVLS